MKKMKSFNTLIILSLIMFSFDTHAAQSCDFVNITETTPSSRFIVNSDQSVIDRTTGLIWKQCIQGLSGNDCTMGTAVQLDWPTALQTAASENFANQSDWRLPNIKELQSIVELACSSPALNLTVFPNYMGDFYWSSSPFTNLVAYTWGIDFFSGIHKVERRISAGSTPKIGYLRLVRGGE